MHILVYSRVKAYLHTNIQKEREREEQQWL